MRSQESKTRDQIVKKHNVTLLEILDRVVDKGVMVKGEVLLSVADVDLIYLNLGLLLSSVKTVEKAIRGERHAESEMFSRSAPLREEFLDNLQLAVERENFASPPLPKEDSQVSSVSRDPAVKTLPSAIDSEPDQGVKPKTNIDPKSVEKGLAKLVLTLVDLIRKLLEKQAIRRIEDGQLNDKEIEDVGHAFLLLDEKIALLKKQFGLADEDLNLDLGPLGELL